MRRHYLSILLSLLCITAYATQKVWTAETLPMPFLIDSTQHVINPEGILSENTTQSINNMLTKTESMRGVQSIVVVVGHVPNADPYSLGMQLAKKYGIGSKEQRSGLIVILATKDRRFHILTGHGLESTLPDIICKRIENRVMVPHLKKGDWDGAMFFTVKKLTQIIQDNPELKKINSDDNKSHRTVLIVFFFLLIAFIIYFFLKNDTAKRCPRCGNKSLRLIHSEQQYMANGLPIIINTYQCNICGYKHKDNDKNKSSRNLKMLLALLFAQSLGNRHNHYRGGNNIHGGGGFGGGGTFGGGSFGGGGAGGSF